MTPWEEWKISKADEGRVREEISEGSGEGGHEMDESDGDVGRVGHLMDRVRHYCGGGEEYAQGGMCLRMRCGCRRSERWIRTVDDLEQGDGLVGLPLLELLYNSKAMCKR